MGVFSNSEAAHHEAEWTEDLFLALGKPGRKLVVSMLDGMDNMRLNRAVMNEEGRAALMEARLHFLSFISTAVSALSCREST